MKPAAIKAVAAAALDHWQAVAAAIDPGFQVSGDEVVMLNPNREDRTRHSFSFNRVTGVWKENAADSSGGSDLVSLWSYTRNIPEQGCAAEHLALFLALDPTTLPETSSRKRKKALPLIPAPAEAMEAIPRFIAWAKAAIHATGEFWIVRDMEDRPLLLRVRVEPPGETKEVRPFTWDSGKKQWRQGGDFACTLYGLERLEAAPNAPVLLVEGEKPADAAALIFPSLVALAFMGVGTVRKVDLGQLQGREVVVWPDADTPGLEASRTLAARLTQEGNPVRLVEPPAPIMAWIKPGKTEPGGWDLADAPPAGVDLQSILEAARPWQGPIAGPPEVQRPSVLPNHAGCYLIHEGRMSLESHQGSPLHLCNFTARIREELILDDGEAEELVFLVEGALSDGTRLPVARVPAGSFAGLGWIMGQWGARAIVNAGNSRKDQLRAAIQHLSRPSRRRTFLATGWRKLEDRWCFLYAGGALGPDGPVDGVEMDLKGRLALFNLGGPLQGDALGQAFRSSVRTLDLGPGAVTAPVWLAAFRAVVDECPFSLHISGSMKAGKTELASIAAGHFGPGLEAKEPLESWESTTGSLERTLFLARDVLSLVDDFRPGEGIKERQKMTEKADRILRGAFNRASRSRLSSDAKTQKQAYWSRGLILSTGEDLPDGESLRSRVLCLEWPARAMRWTVLDDLQADRAKGLHAGLMAAFIQWQAQDRDRALCLRREAHIEARGKLREAQESNRTADIAADLWSAWPVLEAFARELGILSPSELKALGRRLWAFLLEMIRAQSAIISEANPAERFREGLTSCLASGRGHLAHGESGDLPLEWHSRCGWQEGQPKGPRLGYLAPHKAEVWLIPSEAPQQAGRLVSLGVGERALWIRLQEAGWLVLERAGRNKSRRTLPEGGRLDFVVVQMDRIWSVGQPEIPGQPERQNVPTETHTPAVSGPLIAFGTKETHTPPLSPAAGDDWGEL